MSTFSIKSGPFDIFKKILVNWEFDNFIRIEKSTILQKISDRVFIKGDLSSVLGKGVDISMIIKKEEKKNLGKFPQGNINAEISKVGRNVSISKGPVTFHLNTLPMRKVSINIPDVSKFRTMGTATQLSGSDLKTLLSLTKGNDYMRCFIDDQEELYLFKNVNEVEFNLGHTKMAPASTQKIIQPDMVLLSFKMQHLFSEKICINIYHEPCDDHDRYYGHFTMEIASGLDLTLIEELIRAPSRMR